MPRTSNEALSTTLDEAKELIEAGIWQKKIISKQEKNQIIKSIIDNESNIQGNKEAKLLEFTDDDNNNPLHWAATNGDPETIATLALYLRSIKNFDLKQKNNKGENAYNIVCRSSHEHRKKILLLLESFGAMNPEDLMENYPISNQDVQNKIPYTCIASFDDASIRELGNILLVPGTSDTLNNRPETWKGNKNLSDIHPLIQDYINNNIFYDSFFGALAVLQQFFYLLGFKFTPKDSFYVSRVKNQNENEPITKVFLNMAIKSEGNFCTPRTHYDPENITEYSAASNLLSTLLASVTFEFSLENEIVTHKLHDFKVFLNNSSDEKLLKALFFAFYKQEGTPSNPSIQSTQSTVKNFAFFQPCNPENEIKQKIKNLLITCLIQNDEFITAFFNHTQVIIHQLPINQSDTIINFSNITLGENEIIAIKKCIENNPSITTINITDCGMNDKQLMHLAPHIAEHPNLEKLNLSGNPITGNNGALKIILTSKKLKILRLNEAKLSAEGLKSLAEGFATNFQNLTELSLASNNINTKNGAALCLSIKDTIVTHQTNFKSLNLSSNEIAIETDDQIKFLIQHKINVNLSENPINRRQLKIKQILEEKKLEDIEYLKAIIQDGKLHDEFLSDKFRIEIVRNLIKTKSNLSVKDTRDNTVLHMAAINGNDTIFILLFSYLKDKNLKSLNRDGESVDSIILKSTHKDRDKLLTFLKNDVINDIINLQEAQTTPINIVKELIIENKLGERSISALEKAYAIQYFIDTNFNFSIHDSSDHDNTPLHWAAQAGESTIFLTILDVLQKKHPNFNLDTKNNKGETPFQLAYKLKDKESLKIQAILINLKVESAKNMKSVINPTIGGFFRHLLGLDDEKTIANENGENNNHRVPGK